MIILRQPPPAWGIPSISPFVVKLETYLRMAKLEYQVKGGSPVRGPKGKIPYADIDGKRMGDSTLIIEYLKKKHGDPLDAKLTEAERATALAWQRLAEDHLYFAGAWLRWSNAESWKYVREYFRVLMPPVVGGFIVDRIRKAFLGQIWAQGMGRHTAEEILEFAKKDVSAMSVFLGEKKFFMGEEPTTLDATMYGFLVQQLDVPWDAELTRFVRAQGNLVAYTERMRARYWAA